MRIAYLSNSTIPSERANAVHVMKMCNALSNNDMDVELYCNITQENNSKIYEKYGVNSSFEIKGIKQPRGIISKIPNSIYLAFESYKNLRKRTQQIDYLFGRSVYSIFLLRNKYEYIYESHMPPRKGILLYLETKILKNKNLLKLVVISNELKKRYLELFPWLEENKILVLHDSADEVKGEVDLLNTINEDKRIVKTNKDAIIGYLGHLYPGKVMELVIPIAKKRENYFFHIVGGSQEWVTFWEEKINKLELTNIKLYGYIDNGLIGYYYQTFDIMLLPFSKNIYFDKKKKDNIGSWISPLKLFEAMSYKKAILASELPTIKEVLSNGVDAVMADPENIEEWCIKLDTLVENEDLRNKLGGKAYEKFIQAYTWNIRAEKIYHLLVKGEKSK